MAFSLMEKKGIAGIILLDNIVGGSDPCLRLRKRGASYRGR